MPHLRHPNRFGLHIRVVLAGGVAVGPGRADLLEQIGQSGSLSAAARAMGMSYKRAWDLMESLNASFNQPLIEPSRGGSGGGGARLTEAGETVLARYRSIERRAAEAVAGDIAALERLRAEPSGSAEAASGLV